MSDGHRRAAVHACGACGTTLRSDARFCDRCGSQVAAESAHAEYKQVTVLFADVVGSMELAAIVGAERLREIMAELFDLSSAVVKGRCGTVDKFTGDGIMAVFGAPIALEDHAFRACLAALDIQQAVLRLSAEVGIRDGVALALRIGLNSGEVIAGAIGSGRASYTAVGEQVGMAQRMESVAPPGGVLLSESTARLVEHSTVLGEPELVNIKGFTAPLISYRLTSATPDRGRPVRQLSTLVGRDWEKATATALLDQAIAGKGRIIAFVGPPGIGKSRLAAEIRILAGGRGADVFTAYCEAHTREIPFHAVTALLRDIFGIAGFNAEEARKSVRRGLPKADPDDLVLLDDLLGIRDGESQVTDIDPAARGRRLSALFNAAAMARTTPSVYVIEDVHWIDEVSEAMLAQFAATVPQTRSLLLLTYRPEYTPERSGVLDQLSGAHRISLAPLDDSQSMLLAAELLGEDSSVAALVAKVAGHAAGNPLFVEEIIRDLAERNVVDGRTGEYVCRRDATDLRVPASLQATIAARIDRLDTAAKRTLNVAAVIGAQFNTDQLSGVLEDVEVGALMTAELVDQVAFTPRSEYAFRHPLIRTVAYQSQLKSDRAHLHRRLADWIQGPGGGDVDASATRIAQHLEAAGDLRAAYDWHMRAGVWANYRDLRAARTSWHRAREVADIISADGPSGTAMRIGPRVLLCASNVRVRGSIEDSGFDELRELCLSVGDTVSLGIGLGSMCTLLVFHSRFHEAARVATECSGLLDAIPDQTRTLALSCVASNALFQAGEVTEALRLAQRTIDLANGDPTRDNSVLGSPLALGLGLRGICRLSLGIEGWREDGDQAVSIGHSVDPTSFVASLLFKYAFAIQNGAVIPDATALRVTLEALERAERFGDDFALDAARYIRGVTLVHSESDDRTVGFDALDQYRTAILQRGYTTRTVRFVDNETAREKLRHGDVDGAIDLARRTVEHYYSTGEMATRGPAVTVLVEALLQRGRESDTMQAEVEIDRLAAVPTEPGFVLHKLPLLRLRALLARAHSDETSYQEFRDRYREMAKSLGWEGHIALGRAMD